MLVFLSSIGLLFIVITFIFIYAFKNKLYIRRAYLITEVIAYINAIFAIIVLSNMIWALIDDSVQLMFADPGGFDEHLLHKDPGTHIFAESSLLLIYAAYAVVMSWCRKEDV